MTTVDVQRNFDGNEQRSLPKPISWNSSTLTFLFDATAPLNELGPTTLENLNRSLPYVSGFMDLPGQVNHIQLKRDFLIVIRNLWTISNGLTVTEMNQPFIWKILTSIKLNGDRYLNDLLIDGLCKLLSKGQCNTSDLSTYSLRRTTRLTKSGRILKLLDHYNDDLYLCSKKAKTK